MELGYLGVQARSVSEVIAKVHELDGQLLGVHGVLYAGPEFAGFQLVLLPKTGWFDGTGVGEADVVPPHQALRVDDLCLVNQLNRNTLGAVGGFRHKFDCIAVGTIGRATGSDYGGRVQDLILVALQDMREQSVRPGLRLFVFPRDRLPPLPWRNPPGRQGIPILKLSPLGG